MYNMPTGACVRSVEDDSPAQEAGICKGDIIVKFDGQKVSDGDDLLDKLQYYKSWIVKQKIKWMKNTDFLLKRKMEQ